jgi:hypothetical protein
LYGSGWHHFRAIQQSAQRELIGCWVNNAPDQYSVGLGLVASVSINHMDLLLAGTLGDFHDALCIIGCCNDSGTCILRS